MSVTDLIVSFTKDLLKLKNDHPLKVKFEKAIQEYSLERWGRPFIRDATEELNPATATIQEIRNAATTLYQEAERLEQLPEAKRLFAVRSPEHTDFLYLDKEEKESRNWALHNPSDKNRLYEEWWVVDPLNSGKRRCVKRVPMDVPTITAREQAAADGRK